MDETALDGTVALVTGAISGIGTASAKRLTSHGAAVALVACRRDRVEAIADEIASGGGHAVAVVRDLAERDRACGVVQDTLERFGRLDILVNSAEVMLVNSALHTTLDDWGRMIELNVTALLHVTHAAIPYLIDAASTSPRQVADLVHVGSTAALEPRPAAASTA